MGAVQWMRHPELSRHNELLMHLDEMRMASLKNLASVMGISPQTINLYIHEINYGRAVRKKGRTAEQIERAKQIKARARERKLTIQSCHPRGMTGERAYFLGPRGCEIVSKIKNERLSFYEYDGAHGRHFIGINDILSRVLTAKGIDWFQTHGKWFYTRETRDILHKWWAKQFYALIQADDLDEEDAVETLKSLPEPDARIELPNATYWLEFDRATELEKQIKKKYNDCISWIAPLPEKTPIVWIITKDRPRRKNELHEWWEEVKEETPDTEHPEMYFFIEGEETDFLLSSQTS